MQHTKNPDSIAEMEDFVLITPTIIPLANEKRPFHAQIGWPRQSRGESGSAACCAESLGFPAQTASLLPLGWKAQPSSRAEGVSQGGSPRKGEAFPHSRRQSRFAILPFGDFDATLYLR